MSVMTRLYRMVRNLGGLLAELSRQERFYWRMNSCRTINSTIDKTAKLYGNYALTSVTVGYSSYISNNAHISNTTIGKFCSIGPNIVSGWGIHPTNGISTHPAFYSSKKKSAFTLCDVDRVEEHRPIVVGNDVFIGANVTILDGITIGDGAVIGAGAVVSKDIPAYAVAVGCPIQIISYRFPPEIVDELLKTRWWDYDKPALRNVEKHFFNVNDFIEQMNQHTVQSIS